MLRTALGDTSEFVAYGLTNPEFQQFLANVSVRIGEPKDQPTPSTPTEQLELDIDKPKNLLERFIRAISDFLGLTVREDELEGSDKNEKGVYLPKQLK